MPLPAEIKALRWQKAAARLLLPIKQLLEYGFSLLEAPYPPASLPAPGPWAGWERLLPPQLPNFLGLPGSGRVITKHLLSVSYVMAIAVEMG